MAEIVYKSLSSLAPIELQYQYYRNEALEGRTITLKDGFSFYELDGLKNFQDVAINKSSVLVLTDAIKLPSIFSSAADIELGTLPGSFQLQPRRFRDYSAGYNSSSNSFILTQNTPSIFSVQPIKETNEVELFVDNKYVQVEADYPHKVYLNDRTLELDEISRQRFEILYSNGIITIKTKTNLGYRYLAFSNDNILRAVGLVLNETPINDYVFTCNAVSNLTLNRGFTPSNDWVTYFFDVEDSSNNKNVTINKTFTSVPTNLLLDFSLKNSAETGKVNINIANLKTSITPSGGPAPIENAYSKNVITTN